VIRIIRPSLAPEILRKQGKRRRDTHCSQYAREPSAYQSGDKSFSFGQAIYAASTVKDALITMQHAKCCYCERHVGEGGDIEHFRPKGDVCQEENGATLKPGYYWLAYEWNNLLLSCKECNQLYKRNLFPLVDPTKRVRSHHEADNLLQEVPLLIDMTQTDPENLIGFREEFVYAIADNVAAQKTIEVCGLRREELNNRRRETLVNLYRCRDIVALSDQLSTSPEGRILVEDTKRYLAKAIQDESEFSAMARQALLPKERSSTVESIA